jgi:hypothetical protein
VYDNFLFLDRGNMMQASEAFVQHGFGKSGGSVLRMNICGENRHLRQARNR